jgi:DNA topoisomerase 2-associated protein PAT1
MYHQTDGLIRKEPLSQRQILVVLENLYDVVLKVEQLRRDQPPHEDEEAYHAWQAIAFSFVTPQQN